MNVTSQVGRGTWLVAPLNELFKSSALMLVLIFLEIAFISPSRDGSSQPSFLIVSLLCFCKLIFSDALDSSRESWPFSQNVKSLRVCVATPGLLNRPKVWTLQTTRLQDKPLFRFINEDRKIDWSKIGVWTYQIPNCTVVESSDWSGGNLS